MPIRTPLPQADQDRIYQVQEAASHREDQWAIPISAGHGRIWGLPLPERALAMVDAGSFVAIGRYHQIDFEPLHAGL